MFVGSDEGSKVSPLSTQVEVDEDEDVEKVEVYWPGPPPPPLLPPVLV